MEGKKEKDSKRGRDEGETREKDRGVQERVRLERMR